MKIFDRIMKCMLSAAGSAVLLCGCAFPSVSTSSSVPNGIDKLYTADAEITVAGNDDEEELVYSGKMSRFGGGMWELELSAPETVSGLKIALGEEGITASLGDLNFRLETEKIPSKAAFMSVFGALDNAAADANGLTFSETETDLCWYGTYNGGKYTLLYNKADNTLCGLEMQGISVRFSCFCITGNDSSVTTSPSETSVSSEAPSVTSAPETTVPSETTTIFTAPTIETPTETTTTASQSKASETVTAASR